MKINKTQENPPLMICKLINESQKMCLKSVSDHRKINNKGLKSYQRKLLDQCVRFEKYEVRLMDQQNVCQNGSSCTVRPQSCWVSYICRVHAMRQRAESKYYWSPTKSFSFPPQISFIFHL